jgi:heme-degrading monooxygenase HmoA
VEEIMTTVQDERTRTGTKLRVLYLIRIAEGGREGFLRAYEDVRKAVAAEPGHLSEQLGAPVDETSREWVITSEWEDLESFLAWVQGDGHRDLVAPMGAWIEQARSLRFHVLRETVGATAGGAR